MFSHLFVKFSQSVANIHFTRARLYSTMLRACVRTIEGEERMQISLKYQLNEEKNRLFNLNRCQHEELSKTIERLSANILKETNKASKKKRKKQKVEEQDSPTVDICVRNGVSNDVVDVTTPNVLAFSDGHSLHIAEHVYQICVNPPTVTELSLPKNIMSGFPIYPKFDFEFADFTKCTFKWFKSSATHSNEASESSASKEPTCTWEEIGNDFILTPTNDLIGHKLKVVCNPGDGTGRTGEDATAESSCEVSAGPGHCPFMERHAYTQAKTEEGSFRCVTYNILADLYADSDFTREHLYPYCPPYALELDYRKQLYTAEILGYNADLICLQECDKKVYLYHLLPIFTTEGFEGRMVRKYGEVAEGSAIFFRGSKFRLIGEYEFELTRSLTNSKQHEELWRLICQSEAFKERMLKRNTALQVAVLESVEDPTKRVLVATTHLYFHPKGPHVRMIQMQVIMDHIQALLEEYKQNGHEASVIIMGDLNTEPIDGNATFIKEGQIHADHPEWNHVGESEYAPGIELQHNLQLFSACGYPPFTNYTLGYKGTLDYIYADKEAFEVTSVVPLPTAEEISQHTACPNAVCPSDHLALVCDLRWKVKTEMARTEAAEQQVQGETS